MAFCVRARVVYSAYLLKMTYIQALTGDFIAYSGWMGQYKAVSLKLT